MKLIARTAGIVVCMALGALVPASAQAPAAEMKDVPASLVAYAESTLSAAARTPAVVQFVEGQNARKARVEDLKALDRRWAAAPGVEPYMWDLLRNRLALVLVDFQYRHKFVTEAFAMDAQGAIVAETNRTSTYYKGEAEKFTAAFAAGAGAIWYGPAAYDDSTGETEIQVSVPVMKGTRAIGAICFGISLDRWEERKPE